MLLLIILLVVLFGGGGGYYGYSRWGGRRGPRDRRHGSARGGWSCTCSAGCITLGRLGLTPRERCAELPWQVKALPATRGSHHPKGDMP